MALALSTLWEIYNADPIHHRVYMAVTDVVYYITIEGGGVADHDKRLAFAAAFIAATDAGRWRVVRGLTALALGNPSIAQTGVTTTDDDIKYVVTTTLANAAILTALTEALG